MALKDLMKKTDDEIAELNVKNVKLSDEVTKLDREYTGTVESLKSKREILNTKIATVEGLNGEVSKKKKDEMVRLYQKELEKFDKDAAKTMEEKDDELQAKVGEVNALRKQLRELQAKREVYQDLVK